MAVLFMWVASFGRITKRGWRGGTRGAWLRLYLFIIRWAVWWALVALLIWTVAPAMIVGSRQGLQTVLQVLPAVIVAVLVLILGSVAVVAQMASQSWGTRAPVLLTMDDRFQQAVIRPVLLLILVLLLAGQVPDSPAEPSDVVTALVASLTFATVALTYKATLLPVWVIEVVAPRSFPLFVVRDVGRELEDGVLELVVLRVGLLSEMLRMSMQREDSVAVGGTLGAMHELQEIYLAELPNVPEIATHQFDDGSPWERWLSGGLAAGMVGAAEGALRDLVAASDVNAVCWSLRTVARRFIEEGQDADARRCVDALIEIGTTSHQVTPSGVINWPGPPAECLAELEAVAEAAGATDLAAYALAGWSLVVAYPTYHFGQRQHPMWTACVHKLGSAPPWDHATEILESTDWISSWGNKQYQGAKPVVDKLRKAYQDHKAL